MKKFLLIPTLLLALVLILTACTETTPPADTTGESVVPTEPESTPEETVPEDTTPEDTTPEDTTPEDTTPEGTTPEDTVPETPPETKPAETKPAESKPAETQPDDQPSDGAQYTYKSDVAADADAGFAASEFAFTFAYMDGAGNGNSRIENGRYIMEGFTQSLFGTDGKYFITVEDMNSTNKFGAAMFIRGVMGFNFNDPNYYGTDQNSFSCGCGGIYLTVETSGETHKLNIVFRSYNGTDNKAILSAYSIKVPSTTLTVADKGDKVYILSGDQLAATIDISGTRDFAYDGVYPDECAETVVLTLAGQDPVTIENAVVAADYITEIGFCTRMTCGAVSFSGVSVGSFYDVTIPDTFMEVEESMVDPNKAIHVIEGEALASTNGANGIGSCTLEDGYVHIVPSSADPYYLLSAGFNGGRYVSIKYRTTTAGGCNTQIYVGSVGAGPSNDDTMLQQPIVGDGEWHLAIFDLDTLAEKLSDDYYISYFRFDALQAGFKTDADGNYIYENEETGNIAKLPLPEGCSIDVAYVAFFYTEEAALIYEYYTFDEVMNLGKQTASFDTFFVNDNMYFPADGGASQKLDEINNTITFAAGDEHTSMSLRGWIGFQQPIAQFGYYIDSPMNVVWGEFKQDTEDGVLAAGGQYASRFKIDADLSALEPGTHTVGYVIKLADGQQALLRTEITVVIEEPAPVLIENWDSVNAAPFYGWGSCTSDGNGNIKLNCDGTNIMCAYGIDGAMMNASSSAITGFENIQFTIDTTTSAADILFIFQPENGAGNNLTIGHVGKAILTKEDGSVEEIAAIDNGDRTGYAIPKGTKGTLSLPYVTLSTYDNLNASAFASAADTTITRLGFLIQPLAGQAGGECIVGDVYTCGEIAATQK